MFAPFICQCSRHQMTYVGCDCGAEIPFSWDRYDLQCEAENENAFRDYEQRRYEAQRAAEDAEWFHYATLEAAWTYQGG